MKHISFEEFLQEYHAKYVDEGSTNGDMMQDHYESWLENLDKDDLRHLAEQYRFFTAKRHIDFALQNLKSIDRSIEN